MFRPFPPPAPRGIVLAAACATLVLAGCGSDSGEPRPEQAEESMTEPGGAPGADTPQARAATADLAARLEVDEGEVAVIAVEAVTWRDGSLGCAEPGTMYTQALVEGHRITLTVGGEEYEYHDGGRRGPFLCEDPTQ